MPGEPRIRLHLEYGLRLEPDQLGANELSPPWRARKPSARAGVLRPGRRVNDMMPRRRASPAATRIPAGAWGTTFLWDTAR